MAKNLVIVESPAKAKTIEKYLGRDFTVLSSIGHIRSIAKKTKTGTPPIDIKNNFATTYEVDQDKKKTITALKKATKTADQVWLATDEDREGEAIAWHLCEVLGLDPITTNRIVFHEITKSAIEEAIKTPRTVDMKLVAAQQARQILDRLVGFELSPVVWQKVPGGKSAGRVQSPAVRLLVEREREIQKFEASFTFKVTAEFMHGGELVKAELPDRFETETEARAFLESLKDATFTVSNVTKTPGTRNPGAPFTTSTLQQEANSKLGFGARATMSSAQKLYQDGKITYMRTDSVNLSGQAIAAAKSFITTEFGEEYSQVRQFKTKSASAQEAHEAIRPTDMTLKKGSSNDYDQKLYDLIRNRALASQMAPAKLEKTTVTIVISTEGKIFEAHFEAKGEVIIFPGFLKVYGSGKKDPDILPAMASGDRLDLQNVLAKQTFTRPPARYSEGSLVKKLEELGIGRPSTYATIIATIQARDYAVKGDGEGEEREVITYTFSPQSSSRQDVTREIIKEKTGSDKGKLVPTGVGQMISDFLTDHFEQVVDYGFTADVEQDFDKIATGALARNVMLEKFYQPFHKLIENSGDIDRSQVAQATQVGIDPESGKPIFARFGRFGPMLQLGDTEDKENKPQFAPMPAGARIETVTLEQALKAFELPRLVGQTDEGKDIKANIGRFGPYIQVDKLFVSIKPLDPHDITLDQALELYAAKLKSEAEKNITDFGDGLKVLNGRYGPYITDGKKNAKIPKDVKPEKITHEKAKKLLDEAPATKGRFARRGAVTTKKSAAKQVTAKRKTTPKKK
ncbi:MAG: type I DNA topoisomerase [Candidatus Microsaccharimonas sossegonensis]|uniref:DNA topoisomerase 1 n=1 Tax=Candidatus Microsaccharimonas sossegonensis TaxID=2506948 RepID=A0A4Q0AHN8_9BACT|nr:MAG: type I DNA topoisomerase [Candidatus Microsaccharimonas sossegonensis]